MKFYQEYSSRFRILSKGRVVLAISLAAANLLVAAPAVNELPTNPIVVSGNIGISSSAPNMTINQTTQTGIINWGSFNIGSAASVRFNQPNITSSTLNRVVGGEMSQIAGSLSANGRVILINPNGVIFQGGSRVDVGGIVASSMNMSDQDYLSGNYRFTRDNAVGKIINQGTISVADAGYVALLAPEIINEGVITARQGTIAFAAGDAVTLDFAGDGLLNVEIDPSTVKTLIENKGLVEANGGMVYMSSKAASDAISSTISNTGTIQANSLEEKDGKIILKADYAIMQSGTLTAPTITATTKNLIDAGIWDASAVSNGTANGGTITVNASGSVEQVATALMKTGSVSGNAGSIRLTAAEGVYLSGQFDASSTNGKGGQIAITASDVTLAGAKLHADGASNGGYIRVGGGWQGLDTDLANAETTRINASSTLTANATQQGNGGTVVVWSEQETQFAGHIEAKGGSQGGDGGKVEISSHGYLGFGGTVVTPAAAGMGGTNGMLLLDPKNITIVEGGTSTSSTNNIQLTYSGAQGSDFDTGVLLNELSNGNIVVSQSGDDRVATNAGAVRIYKPDGTLLSTLTGSANGDGGSLTIQKLTGVDNFVARWVNWGSDGTAANALGAVTWINGVTGLSGVVSSSNSLVGSALGDRVGNIGVTLISNGNYLVSSPNWGAGSNITTTGKGAVTWGSGTTGVSGIISTNNSLIGSTAGDFVGASGTTTATITKLQSGGVDTGKYVIRSTKWKNGGQNDVGAVTWIDGDTGLLADGSHGGTVSASNSFVGALGNDIVGLAVVPLTNGHYVVQSDNRGFAAFTWGNGASGLVGTLSSDNSLVGSKNTDGTAATVKALTNGNYVVSMRSWANDTALYAGAVTWGDGSTDGTRLTGPVTASNSLIGSTANDYVGWTTSSGILILDNGNYVVASPQWDNGGTANVGAVTWGNGLGGTVGTISASNSLIGSNANDRIGWTGSGVHTISALTGNGNYVVASTQWDGGKGAVTWGNGAGGTVGVVSDSNSLVGSTAGDGVGGLGGTTLGLTFLSNGNYVVSSPLWDNGGVVNAGAVTWGNGAGGTVGVVSASNSLVGSTANDGVGTIANLQNGVRALTGNGNYVVASSLWDNVGAGAVDAGAVTWGNGAGGTVGTISASNSLVGTTTSDFVGRVGSTSVGVLFLSNGNYVVRSDLWNNGVVVDAGAVTWGNGAEGTVGVVSESNSLVGSATGDKVGSGGLGEFGTTGNYFVFSKDWESGGVASMGKGAYTWGDGTIGIAGVLSDANSLVGSTAGDELGSVQNQLTESPHRVLVAAGWDADTTNTNVGLATFMNAYAATTGVASAANSLVGSTTNDGTSMGTTALENGSYVVRFSNWDNGSAVDAGAVVWGSGTTGVTGTVSSSNALVGDGTGYKVGSTVTALTNGDYLVRSQYWGTTDGTTANGKGAVTHGSGTSGIIGVVSETNSMLGTSAGDRLGDSSILALSVGSQTNAAVVYSSFWNSLTRRLDIFKAGTPVSTFSNPQTYATNPSADSIFSSSQLTALLNAGTSVTLQANNDITVNAAIIADNPSGNGGALTMEAGRSMLINADITTDNGNITLRTNTRSRNGASGDYSADRDVGTGYFTMAEGTTLNAGSGNVLIVANGQSDASSSGSMTLGSITANTIKVTNNFNMSSSRVVIRSGSVLNATASSGDSIRLETGYGFTNQAGSGALVVNNTGGNTGRWLVFSQNPSTNSTVKDGLTSDFRRYNLNYWTTPNPALPSGNGFIYNDGQGNLFLNTILTGGTASNVYGDIPTATFGYSFKYTDLEDVAPTVTGLENMIFDTNTPSATLNYGNYYLRYATTGLSAENGSTIALGSSVYYQVAQRPLEVTGTKVYDNTRTVNASSLTVNNRVGSDVITLTGSINNATASDNVGSNLALSSLSGLSISNSNYTITGGSGTINITPKPLTSITGITGSNRAYDGTTAATINFATPTFGAMEAGDILSISAATGTFDNRHVGTGKTVTISGITLDGADAGNYSITGLTASTTANITAKAVTITALDISKEYDGGLTYTTTADNLTLLSSQLGISGDSITAITLAFTDKHAGTDTKTVNASSATISDGNGGNNYTISYASNSTSTITPKMLTPTLSNTGVTKAYDGDTTTAITPTYTFTGFVDGDSAATITNTSKVYNDKDVADANKITVSGLAISSITGTNSSEASDYALSTATLDTTATITKKILTIAGLSAENKTYDGTTDVVISNWGGVTTGVGSETLTLNHGTASFGDKNKADGKTVTAIGYALADGANGGVVSNYELSSTSATTTANIIARTVTLSGSSGVTKVYDGLTSMPIGTSGYGTIGNMISGDDLYVSGSSVFNSKDVATASTLLIGSVALAGSDANNYALNWTNGTGTITKATLTVKANDDAKFVTYNDVANFNGVSYSGFVNGETTANITTTGLAIARTNSGTQNAGTYNGVLVASGLSADNYQFNYTNGDFTIVPAGALLVRANNATTTYATNATYSILQAQYMDDLNAIHTLAAPTVSNNDTTFTYSDGAGGTASFTLGALNPTLSGAGILKAGLYDITATDVSETSNNFSNNLVVVGGLSVNQKAVSVGASNVSKVYDGTTSMNNLSLVLNGVESGDIVAISGNGTFIGKDVGTGKTYTVGSLTLGSTDSSNYYLSGGNSMSGNDGEITKKTVSISAAKTYDGNTNLTGFVTIDTGVTVDGVTETLTYSGATASSSQVSTANKYISALTLLDGENGGLVSNYQLPTLGLASENNTLDITAREITLTADAKSKVYGENNPALTYQIEAANGTRGLVNSDTFTGALATAATQYSDVGDYAITSTLANSNYAIDYVGDDLTINQRAITLTADAKSKTYGEANPALTYQIEASNGTRGLVNSDTFTGALATAATQLSNVGDYAITSTLANSNYAIDYVGDNLTVGQRAITLTADAKSKVYGENNPALTYQIEASNGVRGLVNSDTFTGALATAATQLSNVGDYAITSTLANSNYAIDYVGADLEIIRKALQIIADTPQSKTVGLPDPIFTYTANGFANNDTVSVLNGSLSRDPGIIPGNYAITIGTLSALNYNLEYTGAMYTIDPLPVVVNVTPTTVPTPPPPPPPSGGHDSPLSDPLPTTGGTGTGGGTSTTGTGTGIGTGTTSGETGTGTNTGTGTGTGDEGGTSFWDTLFGGGTGTGGGTTGTGTGSSTGGGTGTGGSSTTTGEGTGTGTNTGTGSSGTSTTGTGTGIGTGTTSGETGTGTSSESTNSASSVSSSSVNGVEGSAIGTVNSSSSATFDGLIIGSTEKGSDVKAILIQGQANSPIPVTMLVTVKPLEGFVFSIPLSVVKEIVQALPPLGKTMPEVIAVQSNGTPLPSWLKFDKMSMSFNASNVPTGSLPMTLSVIIGNGNVKKAIEIVLK